MSEHPVKRRKKLIEVAIPLEAINAASAREKSIRHGHPSTLHLWWARRPLAAARAVIFCQMVDDPSAVPEEFPTEEDQENERLRLFALISELVTWESTTNEELLERVRAEIKRSWGRCCADNADHPEAAELFNPDKLPGFHDPFAGGGALPLEAQRLGLEAYASDLNPVAVLINKAMIEIPPRFAGQPPVNPEARSKKQLIARQWKGAEGLAEDVRYYGQWMRNEAEKRIGHLYPKVLITPEMVNDPENPRPDLKSYEGQELTVIAWLWARTVKSPNPAFCQIDVPLASTFMLCTKLGKEAYVEPVYDETGYRFRVKIGKPKDPTASKEGTKSGRGNFRCLMSGNPIDPAYIKEEAQARRMGAKLMAIVAEGARGRVYLEPLPVQELIASQVEAAWKPDEEFFKQALGFRVGNYGMSTWGDLFTNRQLLTLGTLGGELELAREMIAQHAKEAINTTPWRCRADSDEESSLYAAAVVTCLAMCISRQANRSSTLCIWDQKGENVQQVFGMQILKMTWDYVEGNPFSRSTGNFSGQVEYFVKVLTNACSHAESVGKASQWDAQTQELSCNRVVSTDPPYYDNIGYSDLSDFFYVWLRKMLKDVYPGLFSTLSTPKAEELVATPARHGGKAQAESFFLNGMQAAMKNIGSQASKAFPLTIYYAFKQSETVAEEGTSSTGWETFLDAVIKADLRIVGTWPVRTEYSGNLKTKRNALASSIVLVCEQRSRLAEFISRNEFRREVARILPNALRILERANVAPVDVAQAAIGPGMAIFSTAKAVLNPDDSPMSVREALIEINAALDEYLSQDEGSFDADTRFALTFFESYGYSERPYGDAEGLAVARNISVEGVARAGILNAIAGKVQLLRRGQLDDDWDPYRDDRLCVWEATQHLIKALEAGGEAAAASLMVQLKQLPGQNDLLANCRALAYRLYNHCEKTKQADEGRAYNGLVIAWQEIERQASNQPTETAVQASLI